MFFITISNGLLEGNHRKKMGSAVWEFMWLIDKITKIDDEGWGWVLGGKPINLKDFNGIHPVNVSRNLTKLEKEGYITIKHTPYGMIIKVAKAQKRFNKTAKPDDKDRINKNAKPRCDIAKPLNKNAKPNKTIHIDNTIDNIERQLTPKEEMKLFLEDETYFDKIADVIAEKYKAPREMAIDELTKFKSYWSEKNGSGKKQRWEMEKTFEVGRRIGTWLRNASQFNKQKSKSKPIYSTLD